MNADKAYIVLAGNGWNERLRAWYIKNGLEHFVKYKPKVKILDFYDFMNLVNSKSI